ncbi:MAG: hypothetical protein WBV93_13030 [Anaerobacillus sp.]
MNGKRNYFYLFYFLGLFTILGVFDLIDKEPIAWWENVFQALFITLFYKFFSWAWKSKEYKKKEQ